MVISTNDQMMAALWNNSSRLVIDKASIANATAGAPMSLWRATGQPAQGAIPVAAAICTKALLGCFGFDDQVAPATTYLGVMELLSSNNATSIEFHDRIAHMGGLSLVLTTAQPVTLALDASGLNVPAARIGDANYSDIQWWLEVYADGGATASNATINVTYNDGTSGNLNLVAVGGTLRASRMIALNSLVPVGATPKFIRAINNVTLSASTATAGNFGFAATRRRGGMALPLANFAAEKDYIGFSSGQNVNETCLFMICVPSTTTTGTLRGSGKLAHG